MRMNGAATRGLIQAMADAVIAHADELTRLDQAIGDADHGVNMRRGFEAVLAELDAIAAKPLPQALTAVGTTLVMKVGGASGPLYGTLFMQLGKALPTEPSVADLAGAAETALAAVKARGKSDVGCKTMLDVLAPTLRALHNGIDASEALLRTLPAAAHAAAEATVPMRATRGRAAFLGDRSIGHVDPGARSSALLIEAACAALERAS
jgi:dihydroxyacetone kinase-like protein